MSEATTVGSGGERRRDFKAVSPGLHRAVCVDVWDKYQVKKLERYGGGMQWKTRIVWETDELTDKGEPMIITKQYTASLGDKATLRKDLESWRGKPFTEDQARRFDLERLLGHSCQLLVVHNVKNGDTFADVQSIVPIGKQQEPLKPSGKYVRKRDRDAKAAAEAAAQEAKTKAAQPAPPDGQPPRDEYPF